MKLWIAALALMSYTCCSYALVIEGRVVAVTDGDTVRLLSVSNVEYKVRLTGIDAPEKAQAFGLASKGNLSRLVFNKVVIAECPKTDRYRRQLCKLLLDGQDINLEQVVDGFAWHYTFYQKDQEVDDRAKYSEAEAEARSLNKGLWHETQPVAPWVYRKLN
jgi:endonuclease YncB( thermonuclease family)